MILHRLLKSHLLRAGVDDETRPPEPSGWKTLLDLVNHHYELCDADRHRLARAGEEIRALYSDLANERYKLHSVVTSLPLGLAALDPAGRVLFLNPEGERLLGYAEGDLERGSMLELVEPELKLTLDELVGSGQAWTSHEHGLRHRDGSFLAAVLHLNPMLRDGRLLGAVLVFDPGEDQPARFAAEPLKPPMTGLVNTLTELLRTPLPDAQRGLVESACGYANLLQAALDGATAAGPSEATRELAGLRVLLVGPDSATLLGLRQRLSEWGACAAVAPDAQAALELLSEAAQRDRAFDVVLTEDDPEPLQSQPARVVAVAELPRPIHPADLLAALRESGAAFTTAVFPAVETAAFRVCVVERDEDDTALLEECVTDLNLEFLLVADGAEAWELVRAEPVDAVVASWDMQGLSGEELCQKVREEAGELSLVMITPDNKAARKARKQGADTTVSEPLDKEQLTRVLRKLAREKRRATVDV